MDPRAGGRLTPRKPCPDLNASWAQTVHHLEEARALLEDDQAPGLDDYRDYLAHNELGLAFDVLTEVGAERKVPKRFWEVLREAGDEMCLTSDGVHGKSLRTVQEFVVKEDLYPCPCCGYLVFDEEPGSYDNCPVCGWEDDLSQLRFPTMAGANRPLLLHRPPSGSLWRSRPPTRQRSSTMSVTSTGGHLTRSATRSMTPSQAWTTEPHTPAIRRPTTTGASPLPRPPDRIDPLHRPRP